MSDAKTCGDCKHYINGLVDGGIPCDVPVPFWAMPRKPYHWPVSIDVRAEKCPCFDRKDAKCSFDEGDPITCENLIDHVVAIGSPGDYGEDD